MNEIMVTLNSWYIYDLWVFSRWWMYALVIPIMVYIPFFFLKWVVLTAPIWLPISIITNFIFKDRADPKKRRPY